MSVVALEYHDVVEAPDWDSNGFPGNSAASYKLSVALFEQHLHSIAAGAHEICNDVRLMRSEPPPKRAVLFTFDDGGASGLPTIADRLEQQGWRGHFLVTTGRIGTPGFLSASDLIELHRRGHVIGSHTETHPARMSLVPPAEQVAEWTTSRLRLEAILGGPVEVASVPGGYFDRQTAECAAAAGIRWLFTSEPESRVAMVDGCAVIGRFTLRQSSSVGLARALASPNPPTAP